MSEPREPGFYWVWFDDRWEPAELMAVDHGSREWAILGNDRTFYEADLTEPEVGPRIDTPALTPPEGT